MTALRNRFIRSSVRKTGPICSTFKKIKTANTRGPARTVKGCRRRELPDEPRYHAGQLHMTSLLFLKVSSLTSARPVPPRGRRAPRDPMKVLLARRGVTHRVSRSRSGDCGRARLWPEEYSPELAPWTPPVRDSSRLRCSGGDAARLFCTCCVVEGAATAPEGVTLRRDEERSRRFRAR